MSGIPYSDTISSHDKKRHYLECLEQYILYLHQQIESVVGVTPTPLVRTPSYPGLTSRSIRVSDPCSCRSDLFTF